MVVTAVHARPGQSANVASIVSRRAELTEWSEDLFKTPMVATIHRISHINRVNYTGIVLVCDKSGWCVDCFWWWAAGAGTRRCVTEPARYPRLRREGTGPAGVPLDGTGLTRVTSQRPERFTAGPSGRGAAALQAERPVVTPAASGGAGARERREKRIVPSLILPCRRVTTSWG